MLDLRHITLEQAKLRIDRYIVMILSPGIVIYLALILMLFNHKLTISRRRVYHIFTARLGGWYEDRLSRVVLPVKYRQQKKMFPPLLHITLKMHSPSFS